MGSVSSLTFSVLEFRDGGGVVGSKDSLKSGRWLRMAVEFWMVEAYWSSLLTSCLARDCEMETLLSASDPFQNPLSFVSHSRGDLAEARI